MFIQTQKDNGLTCQTRFQVKSGKDCSRTNSINYFSRITNRFGIPIHQDVNSDMFPSYDYFLTTDALDSGAGATLKKGNKVIKTLSFQWSTTQSNMSSNRREMIAASQELSFSRILGEHISGFFICKSRPPQPSFRDESQIIIQSNQPERINDSTEGITLKLHFNVMLFCLCNAPYTFQIFMREILKTLIGKSIFVYIDDDRSSYDVPYCFNFLKSKVSYTTKCAADVISASEDATAVKVKPKKTSRRSANDDEVYSTVIYLNTDQRLKDTQKPHF
ncbi:hypothetical protein ACTFIW_008769 [Dictyostelium discoideum]